MDIPYKSRNSDTVAFTLTDAKACTYRGCKIDKI